jgi:hypothetical protein
MFTAYKTETSWPQRSLVRSAQRTNKWSASVKMYHAIVFKMDSRNPINRLLILSTPKFRIKPPGWSHLKGSALRGFWTGYMTEAACRRRGEYLASFHNVLNVAFTLIVYQRGLSFSYPTLISFKERGHDFCSDYRQLGLNVCPALAI